MNVLPLPPDRNCRPKPTAMQVIFEACMEHGYATNKADFARLLRMSTGNVYKYLTDTEQPHRLYANAVFLHGVCWTLAKRTAMKIVIVLHTDGQLQILIGGLDAHEHEIVVSTTDTSYHIPYSRQGDGEWEADFRPSRPWRGEWEEEWDLRGPLSEA